MTEDRRFDLRNTPYRPARLLAGGVLLGLATVVLPPQSQQNAGDLTNQSIEGLPDLVTFVGNPNVRNEGLIAYEAGYRTTVRKQLSVDFTAYLSNYTDQDTAEPATPFLENTPPPPHLIVPITYENPMHGETHGLEIAVNWQVTRRRTLSPGYAFEEIHMHPAPASQDATSVSRDGGKQSGPLGTALLAPRSFARPNRAYIRVFCRRAHRFGFAAASGTIELTLEDDRVRFAINVDAAGRAGLTFSSKLLALAKPVHDEGHPKGG